MTMSLKGSLSLHHSQKQEETQELLVQSLRPYAVDSKCPNAVAWPQHVSKHKWQLCVLAAAGDRARLTERLFLQMEAVLNAPG